MTCVLPLALLVLGQVAKIDAQPLSKGSIRNEPAIRDVQKAALRYFGLDGTTIDSMRIRAAWKAALPAFSLKGGYVSSDVADDTFDLLQTVTNDATAIRLVEGSAKEIGATMTWDLPLLIFNSEEISVNAYASAREGVVNKITDLYYQRRKAQVEMVLDPPTEEAAKVNKQLDIERLTSLIDAMTGGWFNKKVH